MPSINCYGAANLDRTARCLGELVLRSSNPVAVRQSAGGVARNVATNLVHLGNTVALSTVVGADAGGDELLRSLEADGIQTTDTLRREGRPTASYTAVLDRDGELLIGLADMAIYDDVDGAAFGASSRNQDRDAWFIDANLPDGCLDTLVAAGSKTIVAASTVSTPKASRLTSYLDRIDILFANRAEAAVLADHDIQSNDDALIAANRLLEKGVGTVFVTLGPRGAVAAGSSGQVVLPAIPGAARDVVGAGDAFAAGALAAILENASLEDAMLSGLATASITVEVDGPTDPELNRDRVQERMQHRVS
jgi:pseudouridine kinase